MTESSSTTTPTTTTDRQLDMQTIEARIEALDKKFDTKFEVLNNSVLTLQASVMPRAEIEAADSRRIAVDVYNAAHQALVERVMRLENGPQKLLGWISLAISAGFGCLSSMIAAAGVCVAILAVLATVIIALVTRH